MGCLQLCIALHRHLAVAAASAVPLSSVGPAPARTTAAIAPPPPPPPPTACAPLAAASGALHTRRLSGGGGGGGDGSNGGAAVAPAEAARRRGRGPWLQHQQQQRWRWRRAHAGAVSLSSHTVALRWCHTSGRDSPSSNATAAVVDGHDGSGGGESVAAEARVGPWAAPAPSTAAWHPCADAPAGASPRLDALLRRLQPTPVDISDLPALQAARRVAVAGGGARAAPTTGAEEEYVPLLFRSDFHRANPHARRYTAAAMTESDADAPPRAPPVAVAATLQPTTAPPHTDDDRATAAAPPHVDGDEVACAAVVAPPTTGGASAAARGRSGRIILDPVEWLAQAPDTPLVDEATLRSCAPICEQLVYSPASCTVAAAAAAHAESLEAQDNDDDDDCDLRDAAPPPPESASAAAVATMAARGFDPATAAWMAAAAQQQQQQQCVDEMESTDLQAALEMDLYADVPRAVRLQQWQRPQRHKTRKRALRRNSPADTAVVADVPNTPVTAGAPLEDADEAPHVQQRSDAAPNATPRFRSSGMAEADTAVEGTPQPAPAAPAAAPAAVETEALVYNVFTRRVAKAGSMGVRALALMGIGVDTASRELRVVDEVALRRLATELRGHRVSWPQLWSRGSLYQQLERLLSDPAVENPVQRVVDVLQLQYNLSHQQRHQPGLVVGAGGEAAVADEAAAAVAAAARMESTAAPPMSVESMDDKLLTVQDLNAEQQAVVQLVLQGHHTYIGGGAGTGKSVLLRVIKQQLAREGLAVAVTGTTGIAGSLIGGCTLHHCLGINLLGEFTRRKELSSYDVIIIDEVSMLSRHLFESLDVHLRRANNPNLPFGGVQMILSGDFLQLGAIDAQPLITSNVFRRNFVQLKLHTVVRQNGDRRFAAQLQQLRRGQVPHDLPNTVRFLSREEVVAEHKAAVELRARQQAQLQHVLLTSGAGADVHNRGPAPVAPPNEGAPPPALLEPVNATVMASPHKRNSSGRDDDSAAVGFVDGAVNLLPTNDEVDRTNTEQLARLEGELITYTPQFLPPSLVGHWSPTYVLRICNPAKLNGKTLALELQRHLAAFYTHGQRASTSLSSSAAAAAAGAGASGFSDGSWLTQPSLGERSLVLYPLFVDALAFRVRLPPTIDKDEARQFLLYLNELDEHLQTTDHGVRVRDVLLHADGMHTEADEYTLSQYAERAPLARPLGLKVGARVMLRTNLAPGLVNGSLGTVVAFRRLEADQLPRYIIGNALRAASVALYADFLHYECGFAVPLVPVVDFGGRQEVIPPVTHYVGGLPNTHHYSMGIVALPLSLAYAFTVHKVQGLTLVGRVHLELSRMWPCEHLLYVAMSRVRNPEQLSVSSFYPGLVRAAADCLLFDDSLPPVTQARTAPHMIAATWRRLPEQRKKTLLRKRIEAFARQRQSRLQSAAKKGDIRAEIRLLEEKMLRRRTRASSATRHKS